MTPENRNLVVGLLVWFAWVLGTCSMVHAEPLGDTCEWQRQCALSGDGICTTMNCEEIDFGRLYDAESTPTVCERTMVEAMRAMQPYIPKFVDPVDRRRYANAPTITDDLVCRSPWCYSPSLPDTRSLAEKLRDTQREYERHQEALGYQLVQDEQERWAYRQWESATVCWRDQ